jgi:hypothetical protein
LFSDKRSNITGYNNVKCYPQTWALGFILPIFKYFKTKWEKKLKMEWQYYHEQFDLDNGKIITEAHNGAIVN